MVAYQFCVQEYESMQSSQERATQGSPEGSRKSQKKMIMIMTTLKLGENSSTGKHTQMTTTVVVGLQRGNTDERLCC